MIPLHIISLERSKDRRAFMRQQLGGLGVSFRFFNAVDGSSMNTETLVRAAPKGGIDYRGLLKPEEVGCALSHLAVIREIAGGQHEYAAIIEDDVVLSPDALKFFDEKLLRSLPSFGILQLGSDHARKPHLSVNLGQVGDHQIYASPSGQFIMCALVYSRDGARSITASITEITAPIDNMIFRDRRPFGLRVIEVRPSLVGTAAGSVSIIGTRSGPKHLSDKMIREWYRLHTQTRLWVSFVRAWGYRAVLRLRGP